jgi:hypothetical protein
MANPRRYILISDFVTNFAASDLLENLNNTTNSLEASNFFSLYYEKCIIKQNKIKRLNKINNFKNIFLISNFSLYNCIEKTLNNKIIINISDRELLNSNFDFNNSLIILTNNNLAQIGPINFANFIKQYENTIVAIHDFDNHHWYHLSNISAMIADIYIPAHFSNNVVQSRINPNMDITIPCGSIQWTRELLFNNIQRIMSLERVTDPLGMHNFYEKFKYRNSVISTLSQKNSTINLSLDNFHARPSIDRFNEWTSHSCHWIIPVYNDLPIRFFDALITGGIPIIPSSLIQQMNYFKIPDDFYVTYDGLDILDPKQIILKANHLFETKGVVGVLERFTFCFESFHINSITNQIILHCEKKYLNLN